jgi:cell division protein FtsQ
MASLAHYGRKAAFGLVGLATAGTASALWVFRHDAWAAVASHPYFTVREISVQGAERYLSETSVVDWLDIAPGVSVWDVSPSRARGRLESHPFVARAAVRREFPDRLRIEVHERHPEAVVVLDRLYYLDRTGTVFGPLDDHHGRDYPVITGVEENAPAGRRAVFLRRLSRLARLCARRGCFGGVSEIHLHPQLDVVLHPTTPRVPVVLGWGSWAEKIARAEHALDHWSDNSAGLAAVDVRFRNQVVLKLAGGGGDEGRRLSPEKNDRGGWGVGGRDWLPDQPPAPSPRPRSRLRSAKQPTARFEV